MTETTKSERLAWWHEAENVRSDFTYEERMGIKRLVNDADRLQRAEELLIEAQKALPRMGDNDVIPGGGLPCQTEIGARIDAYFGDRND